MLRAICMFYGLLLWLTEMNWEVVFDVVILLDERRRWLQAYLLRCLDNQLDSAAVGPRMTTRVRTLHLPHRIGNICLPKWKQDCNKQRKNFDSWGSRPLHRSLRCQFSRLWRQCRFNQLWRTGGNLYMRDSENRILPPLRVDQTHCGQSSG